MIYTCANVWTLMPLSIHHDVSFLTTYISHIVTFVTFKFSQKRAKASSVEESAAFLIAPVSDFVTPVSKLVSLSTMDTAGQAISIMKQAGVRHIVVADTVKNNRLVTESQVVGVINMQDVMSIIQKDERLSLESLQKKFPGLKDPMSQMREEIKSQANEMAKDPETAKKDIIRVGTSLLSAVALGGFLTGSPWLHEHADLAMIGIFILGYVFIILEEVFEFNKAAVALLMSTGLWVTYADYYNGSNGHASNIVLDQLGEQLSEVSSICFFLLAASTIVEVVDAHQGFKVSKRLFVCVVLQTMMYIVLMVNMYVLFCFLLYRL
jgi:hypothetical protein